MICKGKGTKVVFPTEAMAKARAKQLGIKCYQCPKCGFWHLTRGIKKQRWWKKHKRLGRAIWDWNQGADAGNQH